MSSYSWQECAGALELPELRCRTVVGSCPLIMEQRMIQLQQHKRSSAIIQWPTPCDCQLLGLLSFCVLPDLDQPAPAFPRAVKKENKPDPLHKDAVL